MLDLSVIGLGAVSLGTLLRAAAALIICLIATKLVMRLVGRWAARPHVDKTVAGVVKNAVKAAAYILTILIVVESLGVKTTSLIAVLSVAGVAASLALQNVLSNMVGGPVVVLTKPFKVGDYVEIGGNCGTVVEIGLIHTRICTIDNRVLYIPNSSLSGSVIINYTAQDKRRVDLSFTASYDAPAEQVKEALRAAIARQSVHLDEPEPFVRVSAYKESAVEYAVRVWCRTEDYWELYFGLLEEVKRTFEERGVQMTYPHMNLHIIEKTDA